MHQCDEVFKTFSVVLTNDKVLNTLPFVIDERVIERFVSHIKVSDEGCWEWQGCIVKKYGRFSIKHRERGWLSREAHRLGLLFVHGPLPSDQQACHECDNPKCVNPNHLWLGTNQENVNDKVLKGRQAAFFGDDNPHRKKALTRYKQIAEEFEKSQSSVDDLAAQFNVSPYTIKRALSIQV